MSDRPIIPTKATEVTLFEDRAEIVRRASAKVDAGLSWIALGGATPFVDDRSLQVKLISGEGVEVLSGRVRRRLVEPEARTDEAIATHRKAWEEARDTRTKARRRTTRASCARARLDTLMDTWFEGLSKVPDVAEDPDAWRETYGEIRQSAEETLNDLIDSAHTENRANKTLDLAMARLEQAERAQPRCEATLEVQISAEAAAEIEVEVVYRTPCALWRPEHLARLTETDGVSKVEIVTWATAWQITGEDWRQVQVRFSTARPASAASAPLIDDDIVYTRRKSHVERKQVVVEARDMDMKDLRDGVQIPEAQEMPGVDDGGEPVVFAPEEPVALPSSGDPVRVEVARRSLRAKVERVAMPERAPAAHLKAALVLEGDTPLLAGPLRVARGAGLVGRSKVDFVALGEPFDLGFGPDDGLRVRRVQTQTRETVPVIGTQKIDRKVRVFVSNLSGDPRELKIIERVPVSEIDAVTIDMTDIKGWTLDTDRGLLAQIVTIGGQNSRELVFEYGIKADAKVVLPF